VRYSKRDYENASWKVVYSYEQIALPDVFFRTITGWDKHNLLVLGGGGFDKFLHIKMADGTWSYSGFNMEKHYVAYQALFLDKNTFLLSRRGRNGNGLTLNTPAGVEQLETEGFRHDGRSRLYATDTTSFYCSNVSIGSYGEVNAYYYNYTEHRIEPLEERKKLILNESNEAVKWSATDSGDGPMEAARVAFVSTLRPGEAVGLWLSDVPGLGRPTAKTPAALVRYRNGFWRLTQRLDFERREIYAVWFLDERTCITAGDSEILVVKGDKVLKPRITISGEDLTNQKFQRVWGSSLEDFCVLDGEGNVYHFAAGTWKLAVRGPDLQNDKSVDHIERAKIDYGRERPKFKDYWISPDGAVFGLREKEIYRLD
jgi:hypothetical protein